MLAFQNSKEMGIFMFYNQQITTFTDIFPYFDLMLSSTHRGKFNSPSNFT